MADPKRNVADKVAHELHVPDWAAAGPLREEPVSVSEPAARAHVATWLASPVNRGPVVVSEPVSHVAEYLLTSQPQVIAQNNDVAPTSFVVNNITAGATGEYLGEDNTLGEGVNIAAGEKASFTLASGEAIYAAAPDADGVQLRVLEFKSA